MVVRIENENENGSSSHHHHFVFENSGTNPYAEPCVLVRLTHCYAGGVIYGVLHQVRRHLNQLLE
jgi:hypothetical protein